MTEDVTKRAAEGAVPSDTVAKKPRVEVGLDRGIAHVKAEYVVEQPEQAQEPAVFDDDEEGPGDREGGEGGKGGKGKSKGKKRGQNKNRDLKQQKEEVRLCWSLVDPLGTQQCKFGPEGCRSTHDVAAYLALKPEDVAGVCPVFAAIGYCPAGLKCRWLLSHYDADANRLLRNEELVATAATASHELNTIDGDTRWQLQKKKYAFPRSDEVVPYLDLLVNNNIPEGCENESPQERAARMAAEYVEPPFTLAEKKPLNLKGAKIVLPLTTVGNLPYRRLMRLLGATVTYSEMALAMPLIQGTAAEWALPRAHSLEYPGFGVQIATAKHWQASKACELLLKYAPNMLEINLNCGCPIDLLYRQGQGSALMEQPGRLIRILKAMLMLSGEIPTTLKLRTGTRDSHLNGAQIVKRVLNETDGAVASVTMHGRTRQQRYTRECDWDYIGETAKVVMEFNEQQEEKKDTQDKPPVWFVGNGDCYNWQDWHDAVARPGVDSVMVARGALVKPWIFEEVEAQQYLDKLATERLDMLKTYAHFALEHWGSDAYGVNQARRFMCEFLLFFHRYIPVGILERLPVKLNQRPPVWRGRSDLETLLGSADYRDWIKITEMFLGKAGDDFHFEPKHKSNAYSTKTAPARPETAEAA